MKRRTDPAIKWRLTLQPGDLCYATFYKSGYVHIARVREPKKKENESLELWDARSLCGVGRGWYAKVRYDDGTSEGISGWSQCKRCFARHRKLGEPAIAAPKKEAKIKPGIWLAFGWHQVPVAANRSDLPKTATERELLATADDAGKVWGERRAERQRWQRGNNYVRIVELFTDEKGYRFAVRYGIAGDDKSDDWTLKGDLQSCLKRASRLMAVGGDPEDCGFK